MTLTQLEYIVAVDSLGHFGKAAAYCHVTQPTLSTQVQKLEEQIGLQLFDRTKTPVATTVQGREVIDSAKIMLQERDALLQKINSEKGIVAGHLKLGIIPTLAPYLLPLFIAQFAAAYPGIQLFIHEYTTAEMVLRLKEGRLDAGLLVTPLPEVHGLHEDIIGYEELMVYMHPQHKLAALEEVQPGDIEAGELMLLEEGHCFRSQIINLCALKKEQRFAGRITYEAGSLETLRRLADAGQGITILPELAVGSGKAPDSSCIRRFSLPRPVRQLSMITPEGFAKKKLAALLRKSVQQHLPVTMLEKGDRQMIYL